MMDQTIMMTLVLISIFSIAANGQLNCYVCTNCPDIVDEMVSQPCDFVPPPDDTTTTTPSTTPLPSTPNTPPTATPSPPTISSSSSQNDTLTHESIIKATTNKSTDLSNENSDKTTEQLRWSTQISPGQPYRSGNHTISGTYRCFRIGRTVGDRTEVVRGCVAATNSIHQTCVRANNGAAPRSCRICQYNDCNTTSRNTSTSIVLLFTSIVSITFLR